MLIIEAPLDASSIRWEVLPADPAYAENKLYMGEPSPEGDIAWNKIIHRKFDFSLSMLFIC